MSHHEMEAVKGGQCELLNRLVSTKHKMSLLNFDLLIPKQTCLPTLTTHKDGRMESGSSQSLFRQDINPEVVGVCTPNITVRPDD